MTRVSIQKINMNPARSSGNYEKEFNGIERKSKLNAKKPTLIMN